MLLRSVEFTLQLKGSLGVNSLRTTGQKIPIHIWSYILNRSNSKSLLFYIWNANEAPKAAVTQRPWKWKELLLLTKLVQWNEITIRPNNNVFIKLHKFISFIILPTWLILILKTWRVCCISVLSIVKQASRI